MSEYRVIECQINNQESLIEALLDLGLTKEQIEIHNSPTSLYGYHGDKRTQKANIIVRRNHINNHVSGGSSNDLGFELQDGKFVAHVSAYDQSWWEQKRPRFMQVAAAHQAEKEAKKRGYKTRRVVEKGLIRIVASK